MSARQPLCATAALFALLGSQPGTEATQDGVRVRYVANAGMLVSIEGASFLIDAPTRDGITPYQTSPADERTRLEEAKPPYDGVDAILVTHWHEDHFSPEAVAAHLGRNPRAVFISSPEVVTRLRAARPDLAANRIRAVLPPPGQSEEATVGGVTVRVLRIRHNPTRRLPEQHVGFLIGTRATVLHVGDGDPVPDNFTLLRTLPQVDTALLPFWYILDEANRRFVATSIAPRRIVGMHLPRADAVRGCPQAAGRWRRGRSAAGARVAGASRALNEGRFPQAAPLLQGGVTLLLRAYTMSCPRCSCRCVTVETHRRL